MPSTSHSSPLTLARLIGQLARNVALLWLVLVVTRMIVLPGHGTGQTVGSPWPGVVLAVSLAFACGSSWATRPPRLLFLSALLFVASVLTAVPTLRQSGYFALWTWPLQAVVAAVITAAAGTVWPARREWLMAAGSLLTLAMFSLFSWTLWTNPATSNHELQWLVRAFGASLIVYTTLVLWLFGVDRQIPMPKRREQATFVALLLYVATFIAITALPLLGGSDPSQHRIISLPILVATLVLQLAILGLYFSPFRARLPTVFACALVVLGSLALWFNGPVVLTLLVGLTVILAQQPGSRWRWSVAGWAVVLAVAWRAPLLTLPVALMPLLSASGILCLLLWLSRQLEKPALLTPRHDANDNDEATPVDAYLRSRRLALFGGLGVGLFIFAVATTWQYRAQSQSEQAWQDDARAESELRARLIITQLTQAEKLAAVIAGLEPEILNHPRKFTTQATALLSLLSPGISVQWAPGAVLRQIVPLAGQEAAVGLDLLSQAEQGDEIRQIIARRQGRWSGPFDLLEGGQALAFRQPVYAADGRFRGLAITLLHLPLALGLEAIPGHQNLRFTLTMGTQANALHPVWQDADWQTGGADDVRVQRWARQAASTSPQATSVWRAAAPSEAIPADFWLETRAQRHDTLHAVTFAGRMQLAVGLSLLLGIAAAGALHFFLGRRENQARTEELLQLQEIMAHSLSGKLLFDADGQHVWMNRQAQKILQIASRSRLQNFNCFTKPYYVDHGWHEIARQTLADGQLRSLEFIGQGLEGHPLDIRRTFTRIVLKGRPHLLIQIEDLSEPHRLIKERAAIEATNANLRALIDRSADFIAMSDARGTFTFVNRGALTLLGVDDARRILGRPYAEFHDAASQDIIRESAIPAVRSTGRWQGELALLADHGERIPVQIEVLDLGSAAEGAIAGVVMRDLRPQKAQEQALRSAKEAAESASRAKDQFLATMSHELRTPLNGILGMAQSLEIPKMSEEKRLISARTIKHSGLALLAILNDILDVAKIAAGRMTLDEHDFDPQRLAEEIMWLFKAQAGSKGIRIEVDTSACHGHHLGDVARLRQMLSNLVGNAVKFSEHGCIGITIAVDDSIESGLRFSVTDQGIGLSPAMQTQLFVPFMQADSSISRRFGGTGLGLSLVMSLAQAMGGTAGVSSVEGQGSTFWFIVRAPRSTHQPAAGLATSASTPPTALRGRVLVVDDIDANRQVAADFLEILDVTARQVDNGEEAIEVFFKEGPFDAVLMDVHMPSLNGLSAAAEILRRRTATGEAPVPIIAMTADLQESNRERCRQAGMSEFLEKPLSLTELTRVLARYLPAASSRPPAPPPDAEQWAAFLDLYAIARQQMTENAFSAIHSLGQLTQLLRPTSLGEAAHDLEMIGRKMKFEKVIAGYDALIAEQRDASA